MLQNRYRTGVEMDNKDKDIISDGFEYTMVLDKNYKEVKVNTAAEADTVEGKDTETMTYNEEMDRLYFEYEKMCRKDPTVLDNDDIYPHTYYWRIGDRYDQGKRPVLEEALRQGTRVIDTEAYQKYVADIKNKKFTPDSWD